MEQNNTNTNTNNFNIYNNVGLFYLRIIVNSITQNTNCLDFKIEIDMNSQPTNLASTHSNKQRNHIFFFNNSQFILTINILKCKNNRDI